MGKTIPCLSVSLRYRGGKFVAPEDYGSDSAWQTNFDYHLREFKDDLECAWRRHHFRAKFPFHLLTKFDYASENAGLDNLVFAAIKNCSNLKVFKWDASLDPDNETTFLSDFSIEGTPLQSCRLEELVLAIPNESE